MFTTTLIVRQTQLNCRSQLPYRVRAYDFVTRLGVHWSKLCLEVPHLAIFNRTVSNEVQCAINLNEEGAEFRYSPLRPLFQLALRPQRNVFWGSVNFVTNVFSCAVLAVTSLVSYCIIGKPAVGCIRFFAFFYIASVWSPICLLISVPNSIFGLLRNVFHQGRFHFNPIMGYYTENFYPSIATLSELEENILCGGRLLHRLKRSSRGGSRYSVVAEAGHIGEKYYSDLGIARHASAGEVKLAYERMKGIVNTSQDPVRRLEIDSAYAVLSDATKRNLYDKGGEAAVSSKGCNALFTGFTHPKCPTYRGNIRESIGGYVFHHFFLRDVYFSHFQMVTLDRVDISRIDMEVLSFIRWRKVAITLYNQILSHNLSDNQSFEKRCQTFVRKYVLTSPLGPELAFMIGKMYIAVADAQLNPTSMRARLAPKLLFWNAYFQYVTIFRRFYAISKSPERTDAAIQYVTAQIEFLQSDLFACCSASAAMVLGIPRSHEDRLLTAKGLRTLGIVLTSMGKEWNESEVDIAMLAQSMENAMKRWKKYSLKDIETIPF